MKTARIICPNGHLGFAPLKPDSFNVGVAAGPDFIAADSGSDDIGPGPLGADVSTSPLAWQTQDLEAMLLASRKIGVPMLIGSAGDTGSNSRVDLYVAGGKSARQKTADWRQKYIELYRTFVTRCRSASSSWRRGELGVEFPLGAFRPFLWPPSYPALAMAA